MKVSLIVPVYNVYNYLDRCLDTLVNQTYRNIEIITVNDGTTDNSEEIIDKYVKKDKRVKKYNKENGGLSSARNFGLKHATGEYVMFLDSDDYFELDMIEKMLTQMNKDNSDICICDIIKEYEDGSHISILKGINGNNTINNALLSLPSACNKLFKRNLIKEEFPEKRYYEDLGTVPLIISNCKSISYVSEGLYHYIQRDGSIMHQNKYNTKLEDIFYIMERLYSNENIIKKYFDELEFLYIKHLLHDASLRFLNFNCKESKLSLNKIISIMKEKFPNWKKNKYIYLFNKKELLLTKIIYKKLFFLYNIYRKVTNKQ